MTSTIKLGGRFGNHFIRNICIHFIAKKNNLYIDYYYKDWINALGIELFSGENKYDNFTHLKTTNFFSILSSDVKSNLYLDDESYMQNKEITKYIYDYLRKEDIKKEIIKKNMYIRKNNDVFIHVRATDAEKWNPGYEYYSKILISLQGKYENIFISSDDFNCKVVRELMTNYKMQIFYNNEINTILFGSSNKYIILSHGSFSAIIGWFAFDSDVYYPTFYKKMFDFCGDMFTSIETWKNIEW